MTQLKFLIALTRIDGIGPITMDKLLHYFGDAETVWRQTAASLEAAGIGSRVTNSWAEGKSRIDPDAEFDRLLQADVKALTPGDEAYPALLSELPSAPPVLYVKGQTDRLNQPAVAMVGARKITPYGKRVATELAMGLVQAGYAMVSGLALGIDGVAHRAALDSGGITLGVLGCGLDTIYPREHVNLAEEVIKTGALVSEFPLGTAARPEFFPQRNRLISGMSLGTIVVEAGEKSGSLITATFANEQNREVFAVPGSIYSQQSAGTHALIKEGAKLVSSISDVLEELPQHFDSAMQPLSRPKPDSPEEAAVIELLRTGEKHRDELIRSLGKPAASLNALLTTMELKGLVKQVGDGKYAAT